MECKCGKQMDMVIETAREDVRIKRVLRNCRYCSRISEGIWMKWNLTRRGKTSPDPIKKEERYAQVNSQSSADQ